MTFAAFFVLARLILQVTAFFVLALNALEGAYGAWHWWMVPMAAGAAYGVSWGWKYGRA